MQSPVVVASTWSASQAEVLAAHLRGMGIDSYIKSNFDRTAYGGEFGGASVFVEADRLLEAEFELVLLDEAPAAGAGSDLHPSAAGHGDSTDDHGDDPDRDEPRPSRAWVRPSAYVVVAAMALGVIIPSVSVVWSRLFG